MLIKERETESPVGGTQGQGALLPRVSLGASLPLGASVFPNVKSGQLFKPLASDTQRQVDQDTRADCSKAASRPFQRWFYVDCPPMEAGISG